MSHWYEENGTPESGTYWWAVEHRGHPAFYLRALLPGDFAPGRQVAPRHVLSLAGVQATGPATCGTCGEVPASEDLDVVERRTGNRGFPIEQRAGRRAWPRATDPASCWLCSTRQQPATVVVEQPHGEVAVCARCAAFLARGR
jgi:hypothetical protein